MFTECEILLEAFLIWNSVISSFQCQINRGIRIAPNVGAVLIGKSDVKLMISGTGYELGKAPNVVFMWYNCLHTGHN